MKLQTIKSTAELLQHSRSWNDLWQRSDCGWPTMRAEPLAQWLATFASTARVQILVVDNEGTWVAALPLYETKFGPLRIGTMPGGDLCSVGDLLIDRNCHESAECVSLHALVRGLAELKWPLVRFDAMFPESRRWQKFLEALERHRLRSLARFRGSTGLITLGGTWDEYFASRSRNHRRHMRVVRKRAEGEGTLGLELVSNPPLAEIEALLRRGFEVEDRSWKASSGTSTLRTPGALPFFVEQAKLLSASGHLLLAFLMLDGKSIGFEYGWQSKGSYYSLKVGFDEAYGSLSPGQLLRCLMLEQFYASGTIDRVDYLGPLSDATGKWITSSYPVCRLYVANGLLGQLSLRALALRKPVSEREEPPQLRGDLQPETAIPRSEMSAPVPEPSTRI